MAIRQKKLISAVCPVYNNARHLERLVTEMQVALKGYNAELILVDDGSRDESWLTITRLAGLNSGNFRIRGLRLSRNFGQHAAIVAGLEAARGDYIAVMDADLQDDPQFIPALIAKVVEGYDVVHTRRENQRWSIRKFISHLVYRLLTVSSELRIHNALGNYKLLSRRALTAVLQHKSARPLFELMVQMAGFPATSVAVGRRSRPVDASAYRFGSSLRFITGILVTYSSLVFRTMLITGILSLLGGVCALTVADSQAFKTIVLAACGIIGGLLLAVGALLGFYMRALQAQQRHWPTSIVETQV